MMDTLFSLVLYVCLLTLVVCMDGGFVCMQAAAVCVVPIILIIEITLDHYNTIVQVVLCLHHINVKFVNFMQLRNPLRMENDI